MYPSTFKIYHSRKLEPAETNIIISQINCLVLIGFIYTLSSLWGCGRCSVLYFHSFCFDRSMAFATSSSVMFSVLAVSDTVSISIKTFYMLVSFSSQVASIYDETYLSY
jgi:hypothetical protein